MLDLQNSKLVIQLKCQINKTQSLLSTPMLNLQNPKLDNNSNARFTKLKACHSTKVPNEHHPKLAIAQMINVQYPKPIIQLKGKI